MKTFTSCWTALPPICFLYLEDILISGPCKSYLSKMKPIILKKLLEDADSVHIFTNLFLDPVQWLYALGLDLEMCTGVFKKRVQKGSRKVPHDVAGHARQGSHYPRLVLICLTRPPRPLGHFRPLGLLCQSPCGIVLGRELQDQVVHIKELLTEWPAGPFLCGTMHAIHSDTWPRAPHQLVGAVETSSVPIMHDFWVCSTHINNHKLEAAIHTTMTVARLGDFVLLNLDNTTGFCDLNKSRGMLKLAPSSFSYVATREQQCN